MYCFLRGKRMAVASIRVQLVVLVLSLKYIGLWLDTGLVFFFFLRSRINFYAGHRAILLARVAKHSEGFGSSCPLTELAIY